MKNGGRVSISNDNKNVQRRLWEVGAWVEVDEGVPSVGVGGQS